MPEFKQYVVVSNNLDDAAEPAWYVVNVDLTNSTTVPGARNGILFARFGSEINAHEYADWRNSQTTA